jgi:hypothetical protein
MIFLFISALSFLEILKANMQKGLEELTKYTIRTSIKVKANVLECYGYLLSI